MKINLKKIGKFLVKIARIILLVSEVAKEKKEKEGADKQDG